MIARAWFLLSCVWAFAFIGNGLTKAHGLGGVDIGLAAAPFAVPIVLALAFRFITTGTFRRLQVYPAAAPRPARPRRY